MSSIITQVERDQDDNKYLINNASNKKQGNARPAGAKKRRGLLCFFCCASDDDIDAGATGNQVDLDTQPARTPPPTKANPTPQQTRANQQQSQQSDPRDDTAVGPKSLLPAIPERARGKKCLVLDLDETLVHSSFKPVPDADFVVPVEIESIVHQVYVLKRPFVDEFMRRCGEMFEVVVFTASLAKYADPVLDLLDIHKVIDHRLFREACTIHKGVNYVKDLTRLGRPMNGTLIIDNSPHSYMFQPDHAFPCSSWFDERSDRELLDMLPYLELIAQADDVVDILRRIRMGQVTVQRPATPVMTHHSAPKRGSAASSSADASSSAAPPPGLIHQVQQTT